MQSTVSSPSSPIRNLVWMSDPASFETLSGRVRLACLTCRRKKQKCSGDVPCSTCVMSGGACEGIVARKSRNDRRSSRKLSNSGEQVADVQRESELSEFFREFTDDANDHRAQRSQYSSSQSSSVEVDPNLHWPGSIWCSAAEHGSLAEASEIRGDVDNHQPYFGETDHVAASLDERTKAIDDDALSSPSRIGAMTTFLDETNYSTHVGGVKNLLAIAHNLEQQALELRQVAQARIEDLLKGLSGSEDQSVSSSKEFGEGGVTSTI